MFSCAVAVLLAAAPNALAADRSGTLTAQSPSYAWDGGPGSSIGVNTGVIGGASVGNFIGCYDTIADCEDTLLKVEVPGKLTLIADSADDANDVLDMYLYQTNEAGEFDNQETDMAEGAGAGTTGDERIDMTVQPGYYMVHIKFFLANNDTYKGSATMSGFPAPVTKPAETPAERPSAPAGGEQPQQPQQQQQQPAAPHQQSDEPKPAAKKPSKKAACKKKAKKIKNRRKRAKALKKCAKHKR